MSDLIMEAFRQAFPRKGRTPTRGFVHLPGMTDREYRLSIRKAHMMGENGLLCCADRKLRKSSLPFLVTRNWAKVTCSKCLSLRLTGL